MLADMEETLRLKAQASQFRARLEELQEELAAVKASLADSTQRLDRIQAEKMHFEHALEAKESSYSALLNAHEELEKRNKQLLEKQEELAKEVQARLKEADATRKTLQEILPSEDYAPFQFMRKLEKEFRAIMQICGWKKNLVDFAVKCASRDFIAEVWRETRSVRCERDLPGSGEFLKTLLDTHIALKPESNLKLLIARIDNLDPETAKYYWVIPWRENWWLTPDRIFGEILPGLTGDGLLVEPLLSLR